jgi:hypothetical protein
VSTIMMLFPSAQCFASSMCGSSSMQCQIGAGTVSAGDMVDYCAMSLWPGPVDVRCLVWGP